MSNTAAPVTYDQIENSIEEGFKMAADQSGVDVDNRDFTTTQDAFWTYLQLAAAMTQDAASDTEATYTRAQVSIALNRAVDDMADHLHGGCADDIDNFAVNAAMTLLDSPNASFEDIVTECYGEEADEVARWLTNAA
ncbi:hypothetical protein [Streptomyces sp. NPDC001933]|uniref:hypothetical protein n=1 Tax=Streptomyces sp. NPDC001933 TaxID=3364626 RepID=UPI003692793F